MGRVDLVVLIFFKDVCIEVATPSQNETKATFALSLGGLGRAMGQRPTSDRDSFSAQPGGRTLCEKILSGKRLGAA